MNAHAKPSAYPIELAFPDIAAHELSETGIAYVHTFDSGVAGLHVMINALTHGNEVCGAIVVDALLRAKLRPKRGKLTLAFANVDAYARFDPSQPDAARFVDQDFNRVWTAHAGRADRRIWDRRMGGGQRRAARGLLGIAGARCAARCASNRCATG
ncbi:hypothetical protein BN2475_700038 [Paraburkholderia ribeironis]|uniref:Succinylglutamate desuccinylase/Aspartoacylase catalytic domain-containing protein n=1 Tax=Paraburkholderia ribeironis TaxID=1247936 RepID=A0A1N7SHV1_9BURK|nr:hypothetical protein BN2475_700038 [Paraburkholderia ribeironis]